MTAHKNLYGGVNTRCYTLVHGFCFKLFLMVGKELNRCNSILFDRSYNVAINDRTGVKQDYQNKG